ncbi:MAG: NUDIX domain-containing protein [Paracoccaceae bacterium]
MMPTFFCGTLSHEPLLRVVLGRSVVLEPALLPGHAVRAARNARSILVADTQSEAHGVLLRDFTAKDAARLEFYTGRAGADYGEQATIVSAIATPARIAAVVERHPSQGDVWSLVDWVARWSETVVATAGDVMALYGQLPAAAVKARLGPMLVRGASRVRAADAAPTMVRRNAAAEDVDISAFSPGYSNFFAVEDYQLSYRRFDGSHSPQVDRAVFISGDAVTVLPYDPLRDRVLLIEQFRMGPFARGDTQPWSLEAIAGRIDPGETPHDAARREAIEEAGLTLGDLLPVANYYPSPGAKSEFLYSYVALADLPDGVEGVFGLAEEAEDIRGHLLSFEAFMALVASGEVCNAPLVLTAFWLQMERSKLREGFV